MSVWTIVVAAGAGTRFGGAKQFEILGDKRVIDWSCDAARACSDGLVVVTTVACDVNADFVVFGGATRSASVRAGLAKVPDSCDVVVVHDAARPMASRALFESVVNAVRSGVDAAVPGIALTDTIKRVEGALPSRVRETVERSELVAIQTPQAFSCELLRRAHMGDPVASDDAGLIEAVGGDVVVVLGETANVKVTIPEDLVAMQRMVVSNDSA